MPLVFLLFLQSRRITDYDEKKNGSHIWYHHCSPALPDSICRCKSTGGWTGRRTDVWRFIRRFRDFWRCVNTGCAVGRENWREWIWGWRRFQWWRRWNFFCGGCGSVPRKYAGTCAECAGWRGYYCKVKYTAGTGQGQGNGWKAVQSYRAARKLYTYGNFAYVQQYLSICRGCHDNKDFTAKRNPAPSWRYKEICRRIRGIP